MPSFERHVAVTGGAGFIGSNLLLWLVPRYPQIRFINIDCLTYAGNLENLAPIESAPNYRFERVDIRNLSALIDRFSRFEITGVIHLAAESHVDRSIIGPDEFISTNVTGTFHLLQAARQQQGKGVPFRFLHVSTDEVFGSLGHKGRFNEDSPYHPNSPYSASKAAADHLVRAYHHTYGLDTVITNCSNNYGPFQFPEKLIPLMIRNGLAGKPLPVYGDGGQIRDWLHVEDHCRGLEAAFFKGRPGETYCLGGDNEIANIDLVRELCHQLDTQLGGEPRERLIQFVPDRPGHDRRYAIDASKAKQELSWQPARRFNDGLAQTVRWYLDHQDWLERCITGEYLRYYDRQYAARVEQAR